MVPIGHGGVFSANKVLINFPNKWSRYLKIGQSDDNTFRINVIAYNSINKPPTEETITWGVSKPQMAYPNQR